MLQSCRLRRERTPPAVVHHFIFILWVVKPTRRNVAALLFYSSLPAKYGYGAPGVPKMITPAPPSCKRFARREGRGQRSTISRLVWISTFYLIFQPGTGLEGVFVCAYRLSYEKRAPLKVMIHATYRQPTDCCLSSFAARLSRQTNEWYRERQREQVERTDACNLPPYSPRGTAVDVTRVRHSYFRLVLGNFVGSELKSNSNKLISESHVHLIARELGAVAYIL